MKNRSFLSFSQWGVAALFAVLGLVVLYWFVSIAEPPERKPGAVFVHDYSDVPLLAALTQPALADWLAKINAAGIIPGSPRVGRLSGTPGCEATARLIETTFRQAGLEVTTQRLPVVTPRTLTCELRDAHNHPLPDVQLYPFMPSGLLPTVTGKGVSGKLLVTPSTQPLDLVGKPLEGTIVLNKGLAADWPTLASLGVKAVIVQESALDRPVNPDAPMNWNSQATPYDLPFPRFYARGPLERYAGQPLTIHCKVVWQRVEPHNIIGVLRGTPTASARQDALIITSNYDSNSVIPDLAPGAEQAISPAALLALARAFAPYKGQLKRDVIFIATAARGQDWAGATALLNAIGVNGNTEALLTAARADAARQCDYARKALEIVQSDAPWQTPETAGYRAQWLREDPAFRKWFEAGFSNVAGDVNLEQREGYLRARLAWLRGDADGPRPAFRRGFDFLHASEAERSLPENRHPLMTAYLQAKQRDTDAGDVIAMPFWQVAAQLATTHDAGTFLQWGYKRKLTRYFNEVVTDNTDRMRQLDDDLAVHRLFAPYTATLTVNLELFSGGVGKAKNLSLLTGVYNPGTSVEPQSTELKNTLADNLPLGANHLDPEFTVTSWGTADAGGSRTDPNLHGTSLESQVWHRCGRQAFTITNKDFNPPKLGTPDDTFAGLATDAVSAQMPVIGKGLLMIAHGRLTFKEHLQNTAQNSLLSFHGTVLTSAGTSSLVPTHPVGERTFVHVHQGDSTAPAALPTRAIQTDLFVQTDPTGQYNLPLAFAGGWGPITVSAAQFGDDGQVIYYKDANVTLFKSVDVAGSKLTVDSGGTKEINLPVFRCAQVVCYQRVNPSTFNLFPRFDFITNNGLKEPDSLYVEANSGCPAISAFLPPDCCFDIAMMDGSAQNPNIQTYRAFMMNVDAQQAKEPPLRPEPPADEPELYGNGYLAADYPNLTFPYFDGAASMLRTNKKRLRLQEQYKMADQQMIDAQAHGEEMLQTARTLRAAGDPFSAMNAAGNALSSAINNHPVIRDKISNAVFGILWYLGLLVPFVFFFEKLLFGFTDIRKQLLAVGIIFIVVFALLQYFHPAFRMVSSPMMILLGFLIFLLSLVVTMMVSGKFQQTIADLRRKEGHVEGADVNRGGVVGTAFMLGLNNMRRRQVRTGLTCVTLVLITFVMICFTSVSTNITGVEYVTGRAPANGILRRDPNFTPISDSELSNIRQNYGLRYPVAVQSWLVGGGPEQTVKANTEILVDREYAVGGQQIDKRGKANAAVIMQWNEPQFSGIDKYLLTNKGWFPRPPQTPGELAAAQASGYKPSNYVIIPDNIATDLGLTVNDVNQGHPQVIIRNEPYEVQGIFDPLQLDKHVGMDGASILPYDLSALQTSGRASANDSAGGSPQDIARLKAAQVIITSKTPLVQSKQEQAITVSCAVLFPPQKYQLPNSPVWFDGVLLKDQVQVINEYLDRLGIGAYYAKNNIAYYGSRTRARNLGGLIELLIPILIAAMTVFNTMRGSVYERREEIYVYNAVGIAPNHVFFMFMAEACVYAVIGAMLGYLLSQITGSVLTALNLTHGMNMDYSSIETIYASLAIVASVLLSTLVPARTASKLALPSDEATWTVPKADGDVMEFNLPFTFTAHDRVAVISYFYRWLDANGEGSSGSFYCAPPALQVADPSLTPGIAATVWLKPYDLGVSQRVTITLPTDPETGEFIARISIERLSGTIAAWNRAVMPFLGALRKQFLNWRAVNDGERAEMFEEAKGLLTTYIAKDRETAHV